MQKWRSRYELPVIKQLDIKVDIDELRKDFEKYIEGRTWDGLGSEYASLCETHTRLPKMFFKEEELKGVECVCDLDWEKTSYQQLSLTDFDPSFSLDKRTEKSGSVWDTRIAKKDIKADERYFRKFKEDLPDSFRKLIAMFGNKIHRTRFARLNAHSKVKPHIDYDTLYGIRLHIAFETNSNCINGGWDKDGNELKTHIPADGSVWFVNPGVKHYAFNDGDTSRNHLILSLDSQALI